MQCINNLNQGKSLNLETKDSKDLINYEIFSKSVCPVCTKSYRDYGFLKKHFLSSKDCLEAINKARNW